MTGFCTFVSQLRTPYFKQEWVAKIQVINTRFALGITRKRMYILAVRRKTLDFHNDTRITITTKHVDHVQAISRCRKWLCITRKTIMNWSLEMTEIEPYLRGFAARLIKKTSHEINKMSNILPFWISVNHTSKFHRENLMSRDLIKKRIDSSSTFVWNRFSLYFNFIFELHQFHHQKISFSLSWLLKTRISMKKFMLSSYLKVSCSQ